MLLSRSIVAVLVLCGCPRAHRLAEADTGIDAGRRRDAAVDVGPDSGGDSGTDSGWDAGPSLYGWEAIAGSLEGCLIERARFPERIPALRWSPCGEGCRSAPAGPWLIIPRTRGDGVRVTLNYIWWLSNDPNARIYGFTTLDGPAVAAFRVTGDSHRCFAAPYGAGGGRGAFGVWHATVPGTPRWTYLFGGALDELIEVEQPFGVIQETVEHLAVSSEVIVARWIGGTLSLFRAGQRFPETIAERSMETWRSTVITSCGPTGRRDT